MSEPILKVIATAQNILQQARLRAGEQPDLATSSSEAKRLKEEVGHKVFACTATPWQWISLRSVTQTLLRAETDHHKCYAPILVAPMV